MITDLAYSNWLADRNIAVSKASSAVLRFCLSTLGPAVPVFVVAFYPHPISILVLSFLFLLFVFLATSTFPLLFVSIFHQIAAFLAFFFYPFLFCIFFVVTSWPCAGWKGLQVQAITLLVLRKTFFFFLFSVSFAFPDSSFLWYFDIC